MVHFIGAGSGAADLITVRGAKLLGEADVVIYAGSLVNPELLQYTKEGCEIHNSAQMTLEQVLSVVKGAEGRGKTTVRLHTGDWAWRPIPRIPRDGFWRSIPWKLRRRRSGKQRFLLWEIIIRFRPCIPP